MMSRCSDDVTRSEGVQRLCDVTHRGKGARSEGEEEMDEMRL